MNPDWLLKYFDQISEVPDAVPRLRRFILDLAVRGKLVEQDPDDEPAAEVLKRIQANGDHGSNDGERKNQNSLPAIETGEIALKIPENWVLARVGKLLDIQYGKALPAADRSVQGSVAVYGSNGVVGYCEATLAQEPAIIIGRKGSAGALNLCDGPSWTTDVAYFLIPPAFFNIRFLFVALQTLDLARLGKGVKPGLNRSEAYQLPMVVPPLTEQHRIVAKVDELMALCDKLEAAQSKRERRRDRLVAATLHGLNNGNAIPETGTRPTFEESARFYFNHLSRLTTRPEHIHQLRQTILNLAIRGRLVPQDAKDEPVRKVLDRFFLEKQNKWRELQIAKAGGKNHKIKSGSSEKRYDEPITPNVQSLPKLPVTWEWVCWESVLAFGDQSFKRGPFGSSLTKSIFISSGYKVYEQYCPINDDCSFARYYITPQKYKELQGFAVKAKDFLISCSGVTLGRITQVPDEYEEGIINQALLRVRIESKLISDSFFKMLFRSPYFQNQIFGNSTGMAIPNVKGVKELKAIPLPLPPLAEQHRIVAKVDELMALCDQMEDRLTTTATARRQLLEATLVEALSGPCQLQQEQPHAS